jgi:uncharacterized protein with HEPN domain
VPIIPLTRHGEESHKSNGVFQHSPRDGWKVRIDDILGAIARIESYTRGTTRDLFEANTMAADAVAHNVMIIGEAVGHIPIAIRDRYPEVPWAEMRAMRNIIAHQYRDVSVAILWQTLTENLPALVPLLRAILEREP